MTEHSEGRIIADNPAALQALLRDDSLTEPYAPTMSQDPEKKVYVDWPDNNDDEDYRFVSSRIDDIPDPDTSRITPEQQYSSAKNKPYISEDRYQQNSSDVSFPRRGSYDDPKPVPSASKYSGRDRHRYTPEQGNGSFVINDSRTVPSATKYPSERQQQNSAKSREQSFILNNQRTVPSASKYSNDPQQVQNPRSVPSAGRYDRDPLAPGFQSRNREFYDSLDAPPSQQPNQETTPSHHVDSNLYDSLDVSDNHQIIPDNLRDESEYEKPYDSLDPDNVDLQRELEYQKGLKQRIETNSSLLQSSPVPRLELNRLISPRLKLDEEAQPFNLSVRSPEPQPRIIGAMQRDSLDLGPSEDFENVEKGKHIASRFKEGFDSTGMDSYRDERLDNHLQQQLRFENDNRYEEVKNREPERVNENENPFVLPSEHLVDFDQPAPPFVHRGEQIPYKVIRDLSPDNVSSRELVNDLAAYQNRRVTQPRQLQHDDSYATENAQGRPPMSYEYRDDAQGSHQTTPRKLEKDLVNKNIDRAFKGREQVSYAERMKLQKEKARSPKRAESFNKEKRPLPGIKNSNSVGSVPDHFTNGNNADIPPKPMSAEELWNRRAQQQSQYNQKGFKKARPTQGSGASQASRQYSGSTIQSQQSQAISQYSNQSQAQSHYNNAVPHYQPDPANQYSAQSYGTQQSNSATNPSYNYQVPPRMVPHVDAKPILSEDGKTISVDVNLRLMSPNSGRMIQNLQLTSPVSTRPADQQQNGKQPGKQGYYSDPYRPDEAYLSPRDEEPRSPTYKNPYPPLPPIHNVDKLPLEKEQDHDEGYLVAFQKAKQPKPKNQYTPYTLRDYKTLQKEIKLAGLGPDLDNETHKEKLEKKLRQQEYARQILERQKIAHVHAEPVHRPPKVPQQRQSPSAEKRQKAMEYAKTLQRPRSRSVGSTSPIKVQSPQRKPAKPKPKIEQPEYIDLERLLNQHQRDKENVAAIRSNLKSMESPA